MTIYFTGACKTTVRGPSVELIGSRANGSRQLMLLEGTVRDEWFIDWTGETFNVWKRAWVPI